MHHLWRPSFFKAGMVTVSVAALALTPSHALAQRNGIDSMGTASVYLAQAPLLQTEPIAPGHLESRVTDFSGVLDPQQIYDLEQTLTEFLVNHSKSIFIVYMPSFGGYSYHDWTEQTALANGGGNTLVMAIATEDRQFGFGADVTAGYWTDDDLDAIEKAIIPALVESDWAGAGFAAVHEASTRAVPLESPSETPLESSPEVEATESAIAAEDPAPIFTQPERPTKAYEATPYRDSWTRTLTSWIEILLVFALVVSIPLSAIVFLRWNSRRRLDQIRGLKMDEVSNLRSLPITTLSMRAEELAAEIKDSVRSTKNDIEFSYDELGANRVEPLNRAIVELEHVLESVRPTLQKNHIRLDTAGKDTSNRGIRTFRDVRNTFDDFRVALTHRKHSVPESVKRRQSQLADVISVCDSAQEILDKQLIEFRRLREALRNADSIVGKLTQDTVRLRNRAEAAPATLASLQNLHESEVLGSVTGDAQRAADALARAEKLLDASRQLMSSSPGKQSELLDLIQAAEHEVEECDVLLRGIETANEDILRARTGFDALVGSVSSQLSKARFLRERAREIGVSDGLESFDVAVSACEEALSRVPELSETDLLGIFRQLNDAEARLHEVMVPLRSSVDAQERRLTLVDEAISQAENAVVSADTYCATHRSLLSGNTVKELTLSKQSLSMARQLRITDRTRAIDYARAAARHAKQADTLANNDVSQKTATNVAKTVGLIAAGLSGNNSNDRGSESLPQQQAKVQNGKERKRSWWVALSSDSTDSSPRDDSYWRSNTDDRDSGSGFSSRGGSF